MDQALKMLCLLFCFVFLYRWIKSKTMKEDADEDIAKYDGELSARLWFASITRKLLCSKNITVSPCFTVPRKELRSCLVEIHL